MINEIEQSVNLTLDNENITSDQLDEKLRNLKNNEKIVEVSKDNFQTITRMRG